MGDTIKDYAYTSTISQYSEYVLFKVCYYSLLTFFICFKIWVYYRIGDLAFSDLTMMAVVCDVDFLGTDECCQFVVS